jgi:competence protein ComEC
MQDKIFYFSISGFVLGIFFASLFSVSFYFTLLLALLGLVFFVFSAFLSRNNFGIILAFLFIFLSLGIFRFNMVDSKSPPLEDNVGQSLELKGMIVDEIDKRELNQRLTVQVDSTRILITTSSSKEFSYGDEISFSGKLKRPENFITDNNKVFDYVNYLKKDKIDYLMKVYDIEKISLGHGNFIKRFLFKAKNAFVEKTDYLIHPYESTLLNGLILGERSSFPEELTDDFIKTGTIHIVALSGYNVTIIAEWISKMLYFLPPLFAIYGAIFAIILFVLMTGASSTGVRAGIMAILTLIARSTGRNYDILRAIFVTVFLMLLFNPYLLVFDVSFQLSFIATIAVIFFTPKIEKYFYFIRNKYLQDVISVTTAAYIFVLPFILYKMGNLSTVALPANILILPLIPFTMLLGFITGALGFISNIIALPIGYITYLFLHYELWVIDLFAKLPFASFTISNFPLILTILIYLYFIYLLFWPLIRNTFKSTR